MKTFRKKVGLILVALFISIFSRSQNVEWTNSYGNSLGNGITSDVSGNIYSVGYYIGTCSFGPFTFTTPSSDADAYLIKSDPAGNVLFAKSFGDEAQCITIDATGNIYVTGYFSGTDTFGSFTLTSSSLYDIFICKMDANGNVLWVKQYVAQSNNTQIYSISHDTGGNVYVGGTFGSTINFGTYTATASGPFDGFIAKIDPSGNAMWFNTITTSGAFENVKTLDVDASNNIYVIGCFTGTCNFGSTVLTTTANSNAYVSKLNSNGAFIWTKQFGGTNTAYGQFLSVSSPNKIHISGNFSYSITLGVNTFTSGNVYFAEIDASGNVVWSNKFNGVWNPGPIVSDPVGNVYTVGEFYGTSIFSPEIILNSDTASYDAYISKFDAAGNLFWVKQLTGHSNEGLLSITYSLGKIYTIGYFAENCTIDNFTLTAVPSSTSTTSLNTALIKIGTATIGIKENFNDLNVKIYPNPVQDQLTIESDEFDKKTELKINDLLGTQILARSYDDLKTQKLDLSKLSHGIYFLSITCGNKTEVIRLIKE